MVDTLNPFITAKVDGRGGHKSVRIEDLPSDAWNVVKSAYDSGSTADRALYQKVWALYRGVKIRSAMVGAMPFEIRKGGRVIDSSDDYQDKTGMMPRPRQTFSRAEAALTIWGSAYFEMGRNAANKTRDLFYLASPSIKVKLADDGSVSGFTRTLKVGTRLVERAMKADEILHIWAEDPWVEAGPPVSSPFMAAMASAGVLLNIDQFASLFFQRGAIKGTLLAVKGTPPEAEKERIKNWWGRLFGKGSQSAWQNAVVNMDAVEAVPIGEGLESLEQGNLTLERAKAIATALGVPYTLLFSDSANYATAREDKLTLYENLVIPECELIEEEFNRQLFTPAGYRFRFTPEKLDVFQEDENERAASMTQLITAMESPERFLIAADILGYELSPEIRAQLKQMVAEKKERTVEMADRMNSGGPANPSETVLANETPTPEQVNAQPMSVQGKAWDADLAKWRKKALKRLEAGRPAACPFESDTIPHAVHAKISAALERAETAEQVKAVFDQALLDSTDEQNEPLATLVAELKRANDLLEATVEPSTGTSELENNLTAGE